MQIVTSYARESRPKDRECPPPSGNAGQDGRGGTAADDRLAQGTSDASASVEETPDDGACCGGAHNVAASGDGALDDGASDDGAHDAAASGDTLLDDGVGDEETLADGINDDCTVAIGTYAHRAIAHGILTPGPLADLTCADDIGTKATGTDPEAKGQSGGASGVRGAVSPLWRAVPIFKI